MTMDQINDATGFANGNEFTSEAEVREYFNLAGMRKMFGHDFPHSQEELNDMAGRVIRNRWHMEANEMTATITNNEGRHEVVLGEDRDGAYRWYLGDYDTEVSGKTIAEACEAASQSWGSKIEFNFEVPA